MPARDPNLGKPVENGVLRYTSVTALALFEACPTKYYFRYVLGRPGDESPSLEFGSAAHERLEKYQRGEPVELGPCERVVLPFISPATAVQIEQPLHGGAPLLLGSVPMVGWADRIEWSLGRDEVLVTDWKFKKDVAKWAAKSRALTDHRDQDGRQLLAAAKWVIQQSPVAVVVPRHVTSQTGGFDESGTPAGPFIAKETRGAAMARQEIEDRWRDVVAQFEQPLLSTVAARDVSHIAGNTKNCFKYGRPCLYIAECPHKQEKSTMLKPPPLPTAPRPVAPEPSPTSEPAWDARDVTLYFGGSYPLFAKADTLHRFRDMVEEAVLRALLGDKYQPDMHTDVRTTKLPALEFGKWKGELAAMAKKMRPRLDPGHYIVHNEERMLIVADALLPQANAVGGPG